MKLQGVSQGLGLIILVLQRSDFGPPPKGRQKRQETKLTLDFDAGSPTKLTGPRRAV